MVDNATRTRIHSVWSNMKQRCSNSAREDYPLYGGRGITVCPEWAGFPAFLAWARESGYENHLTLDRIDTDGPYCPENCRWATKKEQANNRRSNRMLTMDGKTQTMALWADEKGMDLSTLWKRIYHGWPVERALTEPVHREKGRRRVRA